MSMLICPELTGLFKPWKLSRTLPVFLRTYFKLNYEMVRQKPNHEWIRLKIRWKSKQISKWKTNITNMKAFQAFFVDKKENCQKWECICLWTSLFGSSRKHRAFSWNYGKAGLLKALWRYRKNCVPTARVPSSEQRGTVRRRDSHPGCASCKRAGDCLWRRHARKRYCLRSTSLERYAAT